MIITRTPFRLPLGGGGTDLPSYYSKYGGFILSASLNKYMFMNLNKPLVDDLIRIKYSKSETVEHLEEVQHTLVKEAMRLTGITKAIEISAMADVPAGTGLGSSSCFLVGLLNALHSFKRDHIPTQQLAEEACTIEINTLGNPIGKHDQYMAAYGGLTILAIDRDGSVEVRPLAISEENIYELQNNLLIFYTGITREGNDVLQHQNKSIEERDTNVTERMHTIKEIGIEIKKNLERGDLHAFGELMDHHWQTKRGLAGNVTESRIDRWYAIAKESGAVGGKIMGAGGGGFFVFYCDDDQHKLREAMFKEGLRELRANFDFEGSKVLVNFF